MVYTYIHSRLQNLEIQGIPQKDGEDLCGILATVGDAVGLPISKDDIDVVHRVAHNQESSRPRSIIVRFRCRSKRNDVLAAAGMARRAVGSTDGIEVAEYKTKIFINEHLTLENKKLFKKVREAAAANNFKYRWVKHGVIYARRDDRTRIITIRSDQDLNFIK